MTDNEIGASSPKEALRIVVVEDEPIIAMDLEATIEQMGHEVVAVAMNARDAIRAAGEHEPDIMLMDINLGPGPDGIEAAQKIQALFGIRTIFLSAYVADRYQQQAEAAAPVAFLSKPVDSAELQQALRLVPTSSSAEGTSSSADF